ncbi:MAG: hypothetical protein HQL95_01715 [Magnetococcales bacterium]|nr:hypothetical protein [Magnetococcales bacterium]
MAYIRIEGTPDARVDFGLAQIMTGIVSAFGVKGNMLDFMPWRKPPQADQEDDEATLSLKIKAMFGV